jgi:hypothetical protein
LSTPNIAAATTDPLFPEKATTTTGIYATFPTIIATTTTKFTAAKSERKPKTSKAINKIRDEYQKEAKRKNNLRLDRRFEEMQMIEDLLDFNDHDRRN